jgi:hypothetical protein
VIIVLIGLVIVGSFIIPIRHRPNRPNESVAVERLRTINAVEVTYLSSSGGTYGSMADLIDARLLDDTFTGTKAGYNYSITLDETRSNYTAEAVPASTNTGRYGYYIVPDAVVRYSTNASLAPSGQTGKFARIGPNVPIRRVPPASSR